MKLLLPLLLACLCTQAPAQRSLHWDIKPVAINDTLYEMHLTANLQKGWILYADNPADKITGPHVLADTVVATMPLPLQSYGVSHVYDTLFGKMLWVYNDCANFMLRVTVPPDCPLVSFAIECFLSDGEQFLPDQQTVIVQLHDVAAGHDAIHIASIDAAKPLAGCVTEETTAGRSLLAVFLLGACGGLLALLTPCVFPMIPLTVSFFTQGSGPTLKSRRNGLLYGGFILLIYLLASVPFHLAGKVRPELFNEIATNGWVNLVFFVLFILFALSFFGLFDIALPSSFANRAGNKGSATRLSGIFFMALTLVIVSFSCTGPILGSLLVRSLSSSQSAWQLTAGMAGFGVGLGLPFGLFALFPNSLKRLPGSGEWMNVMKKCLAFVELALAFKFLSNADLVQHWGILKREVFIGLWIVIFLCMGFYLSGVFERKYKKPGSIARGRIAAAACSFVWALYLVPGLTSLPAANLRLLSGLAPPLSYSVYGRNNIAGKGLEPDVVNDYAKAVALAQQQGKDILIDFTGWACVNCRKMEEQVWTDPAIKDYINANYILVSLYVDDRSSIRPFMHAGKLLRTEGDRWATFQSVNFGQVTQPLYALVNGKQQLLNVPFGYTPDAAVFLQWLRCGRGE